MGVTRALPLQHKVLHAIYSAERSLSLPSRSVLALPHHFTHVILVDTMTDTQLFNNLTVRWGLFLFGCLSAILAVVPFVAFWRGPQIRARSKYSRQLMAEEAMRIELEKNGEDDSGDGAYEGQQGEEDGDGGEPLQQRVAEEQRDGELPGVKRETEASARADNARPKT